MSAFYPGDPAVHVVGRSHEQPARKHAKLPPKPKAKPLTFEERLIRNLRSRMKELEPYIDEIPRLEEALKRLKEIK